MAFDTEFFVSTAITIIFSFYIVPNTLGELACKAWQSLWGLFSRQARQCDEEQRPEQPHPLPILSSLRSKSNCF